MPFSLYASVTRSLFLSKSELIKICRWRRYVAKRAVTEKSIARLDFHTVGIPQNGEKRKSVSAAEEKIILIFNFMRQSYHETRQVQTVYYAILLNIP